MSTRTPNAATLRKSGRAGGGITALPSVSRRTFRGKTSGTSDATPRSLRRLALLRPRSASRRSRRSRRFSCSEFRYRKTEQNRSAKYGERRQIRARPHGVVLTFWQKVRCPLFRSNGRSVVAGTEGQPLAQL